MRAVQGRQGSVDAHSATEGARGRQIGRPGGWAFAGLAAVAAVAALALGTGAQAVATPQCVSNVEYKATTDCVLPAGVTSVTVARIWGGGGGGGQGSVNAGGGGGGGANPNACWDEVVPDGATLSVTIGSGGGPATDGASSTVKISGTGTTICQAPGGKAGVSAVSGAGGAGGQAAGGPDGGFGSQFAGGGGGGYAGNGGAAAGTTGGDGGSGMWGQYMGGGGGGSVGGTPGTGSAGGGNGSSATACATSPDGAANTGSGGGGGAGSCTAGSGGSGLIILIFYPPPPPPTTTTVSCPVSVVYNGSAQKPCKAVTMAGATKVTSPAVLWSYWSNTDVGTATAEAWYPGSATYGSSSGSRTFLITPAARLVVKPSSFTWIVGQPVPANLFTTSGFKGSDSWSTAGMTEPTCDVYTTTAHTTSVTLDASTPPGTYYVFCQGGVANGNYQGVGYYADGVVKVVGLSVTGMKPVSGSIAGGTLVHIYGTGFVAPITVSVGGVPCTSTVIQAGGNEVDCVTGAHAAGLVNVVVTTPADSKTLTGGFTYVDPAVLSVTGMSPTYGSVKGGTTVHIYGTGFTSPITVTIGGGACTKTVIQNSGKEVDCVTGAHAAGYVNVVVTTSAGSVTLTNGYLYK